MLFLHSAQKFLTHHAHSLLIELVHTHSLAHVIYIYSSSDSSSGSYVYQDGATDEAATTKLKVPLDQEWMGMAKKMLKGADPEKTLTWSTPEVIMGFA